MIILSIPKVQTFIANKVTDNLNETYGTEIHIDRLGLNWKGEVDIRGVYIADHHQDTLIYARQLETNIISFQNLIKGDLGFGNINMKSGKLYVKTYKGEEDDNLFIFSEKFNTGQKSESPFSLFGNDVTLTDSRIRIIDENLESPEIFDLRNVNVTANDFKVTGPDVEANIKALSLDAERGFKIKNLRSRFSYTLTEMNLDDLLLETEGSKLSGKILLDYSEKGLSDFINNVTIKATFQDAELATNDINAFYNEFGEDQLVYLNGTFEGTINDFIFTDADLRVGDTRLSGDFIIKDIISEDASYSIQARNHRISTSFYELRRFMPRVLGDVLPQEIKVLGPFTFTGTTSITTTELKTNSTLSSAIGSAVTQLEMGNINNFDNAFYSGNVKLDRFNLGKIAGTTSLGRSSANLNFDGRGFTQNTVNTQISGTISTFNFEGYDYKNIKVSGNLKNPLFNGDLSIDDPNLKLTFKGLVDVSKDANQYDFEADVEYAELNKLNLFKRDSISVFTGKVIMDMDGTTVDDAVGTISFNETFYQNEDDDFFFDDFKVISSFEGDIRTIEIVSPDIVNGKISGKFLVEDIPNLFVNGIGSIYANYIPNEVTNDQYIDYQFTVYNKIVEVFVPQLQLGENTQVKGSVSSDESKFKLDFRSPEILLFDNYLSKINIQVDNDNPLYNTYASVDSVYTGFYNVTDLSFINKTINDTLYVRSEFKGGKDKTDLFNLSLYHTINPAGKSVVGVKRSDITYKEKVWYINERNNNLNKITFDDNFKNIKIDSLVLNHNQEIIRLAGILRDSTYKDIKLEFKDVNLGNITPHVDSLDLKGNVNGKLRFMQQDGAYYPNSTVTIDGVMINDVAFGDLNLGVVGNQDLSKYQINTTLTNNNVKSINAVGEIDVSANNPEINLDVTLNDFNLQAFSPFGGDVVSNIRGLISGNAKVTGNYKSPDINGSFNLMESGLKIPYLNTDFDLMNNTRVDVTKNMFDIGNTTITDTKFNTEGQLSGNILHNNFGDWELHLNISTDRLLVLDTPPDEDALYYGTAFISGTADINGPAEELVIDVIATTEEGTTFKIPLSDTESIGDDSFIHFLSPQEKQAIISGVEIQTEDVKGLSLNFELDINEKAEVEVVVDPVNNSRLKGRGAGILLIEINTLGKFNMWGDFLVIEGEYDFRYGGIIQKNIDVVPGGSINWDGSPERARLDLTAKYTTVANPSVLLDNPSANRKIPVEVLVDLTGELIQPNIDFRIEFPRTSSIVRSELEYKLQNKEQREKQALFLVATGSFVNDNLQSGADFGGVIAERVNSIVAEIFSQQDSKFAVLPYVVAADRNYNQDNGSQVGVQITSQVSERILINGKVGVPVGGVNESAVAGDIEVQWLANEDGSLRINFFNRQADIQFIGENQIFEQGAGVSYSVDFDTFRELVNRLFNKKLTLESENELPVIPDDNSIPVDFEPEAKKEEED
ncbi:translocation/assembly module TamB domain-containing protein [Constantimarinum furrinae]|uniref:translocation/assembly module TamB domain-containing protein n=1 Tax=Constantimarinum furrinae TaxID=2562285 RepID=UPI001E5ADF9A|nr:translocation/assembly module TamB domain-containing protein [Constantimarinum furrinae]